MSSPRLESNPITPIVQPVEEEEEEEEEEE
jgi:hypothetical protein